MNTKLRIILRHKLICDRFLYAPSMRLFKFSSFGFSKGGLKSETSVCNKYVKLYVMYVLALSDYMKLAAAAGYKPAPQLGR